jgi:putative inorganic carbon (HCO3(-)) transporter
MVFAGIFFIATALNFRYRIGGTNVHLGGAELAVVPYDIALFLIVIAIFPLVYRTLANVKLDRINTLALAFIVLSSLSLFFSVRLEYSLYELARHIKIFFIFILFRNFFRKDDVIRAYVICALCLVFFELAYVLLQLNSATAEVSEDAAEVRELFSEGGVIRASGTLRHPTLLSLYVNLLLPFLIFGALNLRKKAIYFAGVISVFLIIFLTYTRTQILLFFFAGIYCVIFMRGRAGKKLYKSAAGVVAVVVVLMAVLAVGYIKYDEIYTRIVDAPESSVTSRLMLAWIAINMFLSNPIFGAGWNNFIYVMSKYDEFGLSASVAYPVHNMYLLVLSETGILGLISYLAFLFVLVRKAWRAARWFKNPAERNVTHAALLATALMMITGMQGWSFRADSIQVVMWINLALLAAMVDRARSGSTTHSGITAPLTHRFVPGRPISA